MIVLLLAWDAYEIEHVLEGNYDDSDEYSRNNYHDRDDLDYRDYDREVKGIVLLLSVVKAIATFTAIATAVSCSYFYYQCVYDYWR